MPEINLLNSDHSRVESLASQGKRWLLKIVVLIFIVTIVYYGFIFYSKMQTDKDLEKSQKAVTQYQEEINKNSRREELLTRQGQLASANKLIENHLSWSALLPELARVTVQSAKYTNIEAGEDGELNMAVSVPSYSEADKYLQVFNLPQFNQSFSNVTIMSLTKDQDEEGTETKMRLRLDFNKEILK